MSIHWEGNYKLGEKEVLLEVEGEWTKFDVIDGVRVASDYTIVKAQAFDDDGREINLTEDQFRRIAADARIYEQIEDSWAAQAEAWAERSL